MAGNNAVAELDDQTMNNSQNSELNKYDLMALERSAKKCTRRAAQYGVKRFTDWLQKRSKICDFATISPDNLNI